MAFSPKIGNIVWTYSGTLVTCARGDLCLFCEEDYDSHTARASRLVLGGSSVLFILIVVDWMVSTFIAVFLKFTGAVVGGCGVNKVI